MESELVHTYPEGLGVQRGGEHCKGAGVRSGGLLVGVAVELGEVKCHERKSKTGP